MKLGIIIYSTDSESVWNAFRLGIFALQKDDSVQVFLLANGVECENLDTDNFKVTEQIQSFVDNGGKILACGTCLIFVIQKVLSFVRCQQCRTYTIL